MVLASGREPHSLALFTDIYSGSVGANACMHLNLPPTTDGLIDERDVKRLRVWRAAERRVRQRAGCRNQGRGKPQNAEGLYDFLKAADRPDPLCFAARRSDQGAARRGLSDYSTVRQRQPVSAVSGHCHRQPQNLPVAESVRRAESAH